MTNTTPAAEIAELRECIALATGNIRRADRLKLRTLAQSIRGDRRRMVARVESLSA